MTKKKEGQETIEPEPQPEPEPQTPTAEEKLATLQKELDEVKTDRDSKDKGLRTAHQSLTKKDEELKRQVNIDTRLDGFEETQKILAGMLSERMASGEEIEPEKKTDYLKQFEAVQDRQKKTRDDATVKAQQDEYDRQANAIYARAQEAFSNDEDSLFQVKTFLMNGSPDLAEKKIAKAEGKTKTVETDEQVYDRIKAQKQKDEGLLKTDNALSSGTGTQIPTNVEEFKEWIARIPQSEYEEKYAAEVNKMRRAGKIK